MGPYDEHPEDLGDDYDPSDWDDDTSEEADYSGLGSPLGEPGTD